MHVFRLRYTALGLLIYIQSAFSVARSSRDRSSPSSSSSPPASASSSSVSPPSSNQFYDVASRTVGADIVFEGMAHREPRIPNTAGQFVVRFKVLQMYKGHLPASGDGSADHVVSVGVFGRTDRRDNCSQLAPRLTMKSRYIVFLFEAGKDPASREANLTSGTSVVATGAAPDASAADALRTDFFYRISGCAEPVSKEVSREVRKYACATCGQRARVRKISGGKEVLSGEKVRLHCRTSGKPRPNITWYKDGVRIRQSNRISFKQQRQSSQLQILRSHPEDSRLYQCEAANVLGRTDRIGTTLIVKEESVKPFSRRCPRQEYCLNGGTCYVMTSLKKNYCECSKDYVGARCEEKFTSQNIQVVVGRGRKKKRASLKRRKF